MTSIKQFLRDYPENKARSILEAYRWPNRQVRCPRCGGERLYKEKRKGQPGFYRCPTPHVTELLGGAGNPYVFSVRGDTILDSSRMPLSKWLYCLTHFGPLTIRTIGAGSLAAEIDVTRKTAARQIELIVVLNEYFSEGRCTSHETSSFTQWARDKFFKRPDQNEFLFRYQREKTEKRRLKYQAEEEAKKAQRRRDSPLFSSLF
ncbi:transposase [Pusillimonas sp. MFBS29]|uniref:transposase n=1 Tax=Pusillimonas sp. MFBS29 TaxID=2886690 RepID=UPI001D10F5FF|nr:transposase [Pusillimonas sp. MFBS29]